MRLIDADEAIYIATNHLINPYEIISFRAVIDKTPTIDTVEISKQCIESQPSKNAMEVARCNKCRHRYTSACPIPRRRPI